MQLDKLDRNVSLNALEQSFRSSIKLLDEYKWLYDFQLTDVFTIFDSKFPTEWKIFFQSVSLNELRNIFSSETHSDSFNDIPESLSNLLRQIKLINATKLAELSSEKLEIDKEMKRGIAAKKLHELETMVPMLKELCEKNSCRYLIDIGSGLSYLGQFLASCCDVNVIGLESQKDRVMLADNRLENQAKVKERIRNIYYRIEEDCEEDLLRLANEVSFKADCGESRKYGIISLHSCGDLTPTMLKIFARRCEFKFMVAFSCCYHSMKCDADERFKNFSMSKTLKKLIDDEFKGFNLSVFAMRLACQQTMSKWISKSEQEHAEHVKQVAFRGIVEKFIKDRNLKLVKNKRKLVNLNEFENFDVYIESLKERSHFEPELGNEIDLARELKTYYERYEPYFYLIEPLNVLQMMFQMVIESFILQDRLCYLVEQGLNSTLMKLFDDKLSPRCIGIVAERVD